MFLGVARRLELSPCTTRLAPEMARLKHRPNNATATTAIDAAHNGSLSRRSNGQNIYHACCTILQSEGVPAASGLAMRGEAARTYAWVTQRRVGQAAALAPLRPNNPDADVIPGIVGGGGHRYCGDRRHVPCWTAAQRGEL